jgi:hypothetical protein
MDQEEQFNKLKETLNKLTDWPTVYMFKFIIPADNKKIALVEYKHHCKRSHAECRCNY